ncbi:NAD-dependent epimerase/dehydratase family protein [Knoellia subterranea]|uniref:NAD-dependent epimerase/dehydratase domain-containing protein n=1 Tax=Knoellia subterranea KCTC 19937 TaxID=1385521 RepID=A0A0A0JJI1_9MICO|nr:NAD-dependent epimerase/dehydratase family protein [Knoellia subterranea]KGN36212.1 hypothetical protein N803_04950 [Knoellia subterranea KCTC 19937]
MRYALTGATGFVGGELARQLVADGHDVVALVRNPGRAGSLSDLGATLVQGDLDDLTALDTLVDGADGLFHVAGWYKLGERDRSPGQRVNVDGTRNVLTAALSAGTAKVVYTSTLAVNSDTGGAVRDESYRHTGSHLTEYDRTKADAHRIAEEFVERGLPVVTVMPGGIYGPGDTSQVGELIALAARGGRPIAPRGGGTLVWTHVSDVARGHVVAMERGTPGEAYMLSGEPSSLAGLLQRVARIAGGKGPLLVPDVALRVGEKLMTPVAAALPVPPTYHPESLRAALSSYVGTRAKAERELGWECRSLDEGLADTVAALRN